MTLDRARRLLAAALLPALWGACTEPPDDAEAEANGPAYAQEIAAWQAEREAALRREDSWLALAGLYWLEEGESTFGSAPESDLVFPEPAPARIGVFRRRGDAVTVEAEAGVPLTHAGEPVTGELALVPDSSGEPTVLELGRFTFFLIERPGRLGIRLRDREHPALAAFSGLERFPVDPAWRIEARFERHDEPRPIRVPNVIGTEFEETSPGTLVFSAGGREHRLAPLGGAEGPLFLVFGDATNGESTYGGGRFLSIPEPENGTAVVDFNRAYNPPCVFTPYATCPLPPRGNRLPIPVPAGEKVWGDGGGH